MPNIRIPLAKPHLSQTAKENVLACLDQNWLSQGAFNTELENAFAKRIGTTYAVSCSNGTAALWLALKALNVKTGDEIIVPTLTFSATAAAVVAAGGIPVFVDSRKTDLNIDPVAVEQAITPKTRGIISVDLYGIAAPYDELETIANAHKLFLIEDAAEALGGAYKGKPLGSFGQVGTFSFFPNKVMTTGEGGMCTTNSKELADMMVLYKNHGNPTARAYWPEVSGFNMRMTNMQAAIGVSQEKELDSLLTERYGIFEEYLRLLKDVQGIVSLSFAERSFGPWLMTVRAIGKKKEEVVAKLLEAGIESRPGFYPLHHTPAFTSFAKSTDRYPVADQISTELINLPTFIGITKKEIAEVMETLAQISHS